MCVLICSLFFFLMHCFVCCGLNCCHVIFYRFNVLILCLGPQGNSVKGMIWKIKEIKKLSTEEAASQEPRTKYKCLK